MILTRLSSLVEWTSCAVVYTVSYGLTRSLTVLYDRLYDHTRTWHPCQFFKSFKNHTRLSRIHSNGPSVTRIRPRLVRLYVRFTRVANRKSRVFCVRQALSNYFYKESIHNPIALRKAKIAYNFGLSAGNSVR